MRRVSSTLVAAACAAGVLAAPTPEKRNNVPGDGGNGLTTTVLDPTSNQSIADPTYRAITDFDYASFNLGVYQEYIELDLFHYGLARFTPAEFEEAGITADQQGLLSFMAAQESGHAQLLTNILGPGASKRCTYNYTGAFTDVRSYVDFCQKLTRWGESGVYGFLAQLNSRPSAQLLTQSIATEARQQQVFREFLGAPSMDVFFETGIPQAWAWTLLAPWIQSCPAENQRVMWSNYPALHVVNGPSLLRSDSKSAVTTNVTQLYTPKETKIQLKWDAPGQKVGPDGMYTTVKPGGEGKYALFQQSYNISYAPITMTGQCEGYATIPFTYIYDTELANTGTAFNGTGFVAVVDTDLPLTPFNSTLILPHMVAGPAIIQFG